MATGTVKRIFRDRGFGFIKVDGQPKDIFFHRTHLRDGDFETMQEGILVEYEVVVSDKGPRVAWVKGIGPAPAK